MNAVAVAIGLCALWATVWAATVSIAIRNVRRRGDDVLAAVEQLSGWLAESRPVAPIHLPAGAWDLPLDPSLPDIPQAPPAGRLVHPEPLVDPALADPAGPKPWAYPSRHQHGGVL